MNSYTDSSPIRDAVYREAQSFCTSKGLNLKVIRERTLNDQTIIDYKCLSATSSEYLDNTKYETPDQVIISNTDIENKSENKK